MLPKLGSALEVFFTGDTFPARLPDKDYPVLRLWRGQRGRKLLRTGSRALSAVLPKWKCRTQLSSPWHQTEASRLSISRESCSLASELQQINIKALKKSTNQPTNQPKPKLLHYPELAPYYLLELWFIPLIMCTPSECYPVV